MIGVVYVIGEVFVFLDSYCEVNMMWLQFLLVVICEDQYIVVCLVIDIISVDMLVYSLFFVVCGGFNWGLYFKWDFVFFFELGVEGVIVLIKLLIMVGGLFVMNRQYFYEFGQYDSGMDIWGGENLEILFWIWMCGGKFFIIFCFRVGYIF